MPFSVIPSLDVSGGRLVGWTAGGARPLEAFGADPSVAAAALRDAGTSWIHVADVDHAVAGRPVDTTIISRMREQLPDIAVQASGGLEHADVDVLVAAGATRVVLGSSALTDIEATSALVARHGERLVVGIEVQDGAIVARGREPVALGLMETLGWLAAAGARAFLVTSVARVGGLGGPDLGTLRRVTRAGPPVLAAGGISSIEDLQAIRGTGASGAVVGRAVLEGRLDLGRALAWAAAP